MTIADIQAKSENWNMRVIGHHDLNGHGDGMQLLKQGRYVYLAHLGTSPMALSILDVADPSDPRVVTQMPHAPNTHAHKVQIVGDILIQNQERPYFDKICSREHTERSRHQSLQHRKTYRAARDRLLKTSRQGRASHVVHRRQVRARRRDAAGHQRARLFDRRCFEPDQSERSGAVVDSRHEGRRGDAAGLDAISPASIFTCMARFRMATDPTLPWSMPAW